MTLLRYSVDDPGIAGAIESLERIIRERYPEARFFLSEGCDPEGIYLEATLAAGDPDDLFDDDRLLDLLFDIQGRQDLPVYVFAYRPATTTNQLMS